MMESRRLGRALSEQARALPHREGMPNRKCRRCGKAGLIRSERVITGRRAVTIYYCGGCGYSWEEQDDPADPPQ
jgi:predicted RNA-binding Zn-ribbon protein involved in translation (DUF1610 family)